MADLPPRRRGTVRRVLIILAAVAVVCCGGAVSSGYRLAHRAPPAQRVADAFLTRLERDDTTGAYPLLCADLRAHMSARMFATRIHAGPRLRAHAIIGTSQSTADRVPTALVATELTWASGTRDRHTVRLVRDGRSWAVC